MPTQKQKSKNNKQLATAHHDYGKRMNSYASYKVSNKETGQDLVQDTFMKTWKYLVKGGKIDLMKPFLYHILNHLIIDEYRKRKTSSKISSLDALLKKGFEPSFDNTERIIDTFDGKEVLPLIQHLPKKYERVIRMRYIQELSLKEISLITGQTRNAISVQAHRGLVKLKALYNKN